MGTVASLHLRAGGASDGARAAAEGAAVAAAFEHLHDVDRRFSWYRDDSEIRRLDRGELDGSAASPDVRGVLRTCEELREATGGIFDVRGHRPDGSLDPSGYVKGWAIEGSAEILRAAGIRDFCLDVGGDVVAAGEPEPGRGWRVGIRHPELARGTAAVLEVRDLAVATSGGYERGAHIRDPRTGAPPVGLASITIVGSSLARADVHATIAFAMGLDGIAWAARQPGLEVLAITAGRRVRWTPGLDDLLVVPRPPAPRRGTDSREGRAGPLLRGASA